MNSTQPSDNKYKPQPDYGVAVGETPWDKLTVSQRTERLAYVVKSVQAAIRKINADHRDLGRGFQMHQHIADGTVVLPVSKCSVPSPFDGNPGDDCAGSADRWI